MGRLRVVTGGGRGIGEAIALGLADAGADVVVAARRTAEVEAVAEKIRAKGRRALAVTCDCDGHRASKGARGARSG